MKVTDLSDVVGSVVTSVTVDKTWVVIVVEGDTARDR